MVGESTPSDHRNGSGGCWIRPPPSLTTGSAVVGSGGGGERCPHLRERRRWADPHPPTSGVATVGGQRPCLEAGDGWHWAS
uniref:Uncharacterized protein n=1 Tax=Oryza rufipogon TaxID=4529 RepID=A0A0E0NWB6_ORYRU